MPASPSTGTQVPALTVLTAPMSVTEERSILDEDAAAGFAGLTVVRLAPQADPRPLNWPEGPLVTGHLWRPRGRVRPAAASSPTRSVGLEGQDVGALRRPMGKATRQGVVGALQLTALGR